MLEPEEEESDGPFDVPLSDVPEFVELADASLCGVLIQLVLVLVSYVGARFKSLSKRH